MKRALIYIVGIWIAVLIHAWATRFVMVSIDDNTAYLTNRMTGDVYRVHGFRVRGPLEWHPMPEEQTEKSQ